MDLNEAITTIEYHITVTGRGLSSTNEAWQTLKAAVLAQQTTNTQSAPCCPDCGVL